jgi:hypothetical protein
MEIAIDHKLSDDVIRMFEAESKASINPESISLGAAMEIVFWAKQQASKSHPVLEQWRKSHPFLKLCWEGLLSSKRPSTTPFQALDAEYFKISKETSFGNLEWGQFLARFTSAMKRHGMQQTISHGIPGAFHEIAENVQQHSCYAHPSHEMAGLAAYSVTARKLSFVVGDVGIGALASLKTNPAWSSLRTDREALHAIAQEQASRRVGQGCGQGYRDVFMALASYNGTVRLRSNCGIFQLTGELGRSTATGAVGPLISGFHLTVECEF